MCKLLPHTSCPLPLDTDAVVAPDPQASAKKRNFSTLAFEAEGPQVVHTDNLSEQQGGLKGTLCIVAKLLTRMTVLSLLKKLHLPRELVPYLYQFKLQAKPN